MRLILRVYIGRTSWCRERQYEALPQIGQMVYEKDVEVFGRVGDVEFESGVPVITLTATGDEFEESGVAESGYRQLEVEQMFAA